MEFDKFIKQIFDIFILFGVVLVTFFFIIVSVYRILLFAFILASLLFFFLIYLYDKSLIKIFGCFFIIWGYWILYSFGYFIILDDLHQFFNSFILKAVTLGISLPFTFYVNYKILEIERGIISLFLIISLVFFSFPFSDNNCFLNLWKSTMRVIVFAIVYVTIYFRLRRNRIDNIFEKSASLVIHILFGDFVLSITFGLIQLIWNFIKIVKEDTINKSNTIEEKYENEADVESSD